LLERGRNGIRVTIDEAPVDDRLPSPAEQADRLILWAGDQQASPGEDIPINISEVSAWIGAAISSGDPWRGFRWLRAQESINTLFEHTAGYSTSGGGPTLKLSLAGWKCYEQIKHRQITSRTAFMAMKFNDEELDRVFQTCFKPAVYRAGFELRRLTDGQPAGLIDDQMRVALRTSRFILADLSHGNRGAYWEAGFAEGLGRDVIYTCRKDCWDKLDSDGNRLVHFDAGHLVTIPWEPEKLEEAGKQLTAKIRATLPAEAQMTDP
jgi:hypothetical protein